MASSLDGVIKVFTSNTYVIPRDQLTDHTVLDGDGYTFSMTIFGVAPPTGYHGDSVTITGTGFGATRGSSTVTIDGHPATILFWSGTSIIVRIPYGASVGVVTIVVTVTDGGTVSSTLTVLYDSHKLRFVDYKYSLGGGLYGSPPGGILLDINDGTIYCFDEIQFPIPKPRIEWRDPAHGDGRDVNFSKYENRTVTIRMHVFGTDEADLASNIEALWEQLLADFPILEWRPSGWDDPLYIDLIGPPLEINTPDWFETYMRENGQIHVLSNIEIVIEAKPFLRGPEETVVLLNAAPGVSGIVVDESQFKGDVPAPADIHVDLVSGELWTDLIFGQRLKYSASFDPIQEPTVGTIAYNADRLSGDYRTRAAQVDKLEDTIFAQHGATSGNTTDWDHWAETRSGTNAWMSTEAAPVYTGTHCVKVGCSNPTGPFFLILMSDSVAVTTSKTYFTQLVYGFQSRALMLGEQAYAQLYVDFYNGGAFLDWKNLSFDNSISLSSWESMAGYIVPADFPATTTHIKVFLRLYSDYYTQTYSLQALYAYFGFASFVECVPGVVQAEYPLDSHEGRYLPVGAVSFAAGNIDDNVTFQAMLATSAGAEITPSINPATVDTGNPNTKFAEVAMLNPRLPVISIPTHKISNLADKTNIEQIIRLATSPLNTQDFWYDYLGIVPIDRAYAEVRNWTGNPHLILDGRSSNLALTSLDGTLDAAQTYDMAKQKSECSFVADPDGFNGAIVALAYDAGDYEVASNVEVTMVYHPLYLLVPEG